MENHRNKGKKWVRATAARHKDGVVPSEGGENQGAPPASTGVRGQKGKKKRQKRSREAPWGERTSPLKKKKGGGGGGVRRVKQTEPRKWEGGPKLKTKKKHSHHPQQAAKRRKEKSWVEIKNTIRKKN